MATIFEMTGDEREQRIAELKQKMQQNAKRAQAEAEAEQSEESVPEVTAEAPATTEVAEEPIAEGPIVESSTVEGANGTASPAVAANVTAAPVSTPVASAAVEEEVDDGQAALTRREFLTYAWGAALGLLAIESGLASYFFMYPRFRAGEFGGKFFLKPTDIPSLDTPPVPMTSGKFWFVNIEDEGPKALYMVCTHLGCLYKWQASNNRFECPCHGSKFSKRGYYIEGPAPRSLDTFEVIQENDQVIVDTGAKVTGNPSSESPDRAAVA